MSGEKTGKVTIICVIVFFVFLGIAAWIENAGFEEYEADVFRYRTLYGIQRGMIYDIFPIFGYTGEIMWAEETTLAETVFDEEMPVFKYLNEEVGLKSANEDAETILKVYFAKDALPEIETKITQSMMEMKKEYARD